MNYEKRLADLQKELSLPDTDPVTRLKRNLPLVSDIINDIRKEVVEHGFENEAAEIHFFKYIKPAFLALQVYEVDLYNLIIQRPTGTPEMLRAYYEQELLYIIRFFRIHAFHYQYYRASATELDHQYFRRDGQPSGIPVPEAIALDPGFSTPLDYLYAKFIAAERSQEYLLEQLSSQLTSKPVKHGPILRWTGEAINIVETAYGWWLTGQLNDGNATITDIIGWLEENLSVKIGVPAKRWEQISARTHSAPTKYLDRMTEAVKQRIDEELGKRDQKRKARRIS